MPRPTPWHGTQIAAWAHWRVTEDPELALTVLGGALRSPRQAPLLHRLADLGPIASAYADDVRHLFDHAGDWTRLTAAHAWWRITGDPEPALPELLRAPAPVRSGRATEHTLIVVRLLGDIGPPARKAADTLRTIVANERRVGGSILADEELCRATGAALTAIER
ncbi:hypothetical protein [Embleya sp. NPDC005971]|uniref:hypothetical protein n=1 Tax=Embleya sp. NPDC005971 TaxID=3156724 RepID=UPI00340B2795